MNLSNPWSQLEQNLPTRSTSSARAHRGPYARPSIIDKETRYCPYSKKPMTIRATKAGSEKPNMNLTSTAERIINTLSNCSTPVINVKKSPSNVSKPELKGFTGPPTVRASLDTTIKPRAIISDETGGTNVPDRRSSSGEFNTQNLVDELFPPSDVVDLEPEQQSASDSDDDSSVEYFEPSGKIGISKVKFNAWSMDQFANCEESSDSSSEDESGSTDGQALVDSDKSTEKSEHLNLSDVKTPTPTVIKTSNTEKWECSGCMLHVAMHESACPCCQTPNPNPKTAAESTSSGKNSDPPSVPAPSFVFGFNPGAPATTTTTSNSTFKFGESIPTQPSLLTKFKLGFNSNSDSPSTSFSVPPASTENDPASMQAEVVDFAKKSAKEETWECPVCMIFNKKSQLKCVACQEPQPQSKPQASSPKGNDTSVPHKSPAFSSTISEPPPFAQSNINEKSTSPSKRKMSFGLKHEDEAGSDVPTDASKQNPFSGLSFTPSSNFYSQKNESIKTTPASSNEEGWKENKTGSGVDAPKPQSSANYEKYTFQPFFKNDQASTVQPKSEPVTTFNPASTILGSTFPPVTPAAPLSTGGFSFGTPISSAPSSTTSSTPGFKFGATQSGDGLKRKADEGSATSGFSFGGSEPKLKLKSTGAEAPIQVPSVGLKSGSVLDALKQPGFLGMDKPDGTQIPAPSTTPQTPQTNFTFPTTTTATATPTFTQTPGFSFGTPQSNVASPGFQFGTNNQTNTTPIFGSSGTPQPSMPSGFNFGTPAPMGTPGASFSLTPNINFSTPPAAASNQPFTFQAQSTQGQGQVDTGTPRKFRRAVRRTK